MGIISTIKTARISYFSHAAGCFKQSNPLTSADSLLYISTLDGSLHGVSKVSGEIQWTLKEGTRYILAQMFFNLIFDSIITITMFMFLNRNTRLISLCSCQCFTSNLVYFRSSS